MNILVVEDDIAKYEDIKLTIENIERSLDKHFVLCKSVNDGLVKIGSEKFDLIVIDILIPQIIGSDAQSIGHTLLPAIASSKLNYSANVVAITKYGSEAEKNWSSFRDLGVAVLEYNQDRQEWSKALQMIVQRIRPKTKYDFAIFCALPAEAVAFRDTPMEVGAGELRFGVSSYSAQVENWSGRIFVAPQVGPVDAASIVARIFENIDPDIFCIAGICGGHPDRTDLGQLIIADPCWDHQSGKLTPNGLLSEAYQIRIPADTREALSELAQDTSLHAQFLQASPPQLPNHPSPPKVAPFGSGATVIADDASKDSLEDNHRKITGIDMEMYAAYRVAFMKGRPSFFGAKAVVDHIGVDKDDVWHAFAANYSARFCTTAICRLLDQAK